METVTGKTLLTGPRDCGSVPAKSTNTSPLRIVSETAISSGRSSCPFPSIRSDAEYVPFGRSRLSRSARSEWSRYSSTAPSTTSRPYLSRRRTTPLTPASFAAICASRSPSTSLGVRTLARRISETASMRVPRIDEPGWRDPDPFLVDLAGHRKAARHAAADVAVMSAVPGEHHDLVTDEDRRDQRDIRKMRSALVRIVEDEDIAWAHLVPREPVDARHHCEMHRPDVPRAVACLGDELCVRGEEGAREVFADVDDRRQRGVSERAGPSLRRSRTGRRRSRRT